MLQASSFISQWHFFVLVFCFFMQFQQLTLLIEGISTEILKGRIQTLSMHVHLHLQLGWKKTKHWPFQSSWHFVKVKCSFLRVNTRWDLSGKLCISLTDLFKVTHQSCHEKGICSREVFYILSGKQTKHKADESHTTTKILTPEWKKKEKHMYQRTEKRKHLHCKIRK